MSTGSTTEGASKFYQQFFTGPELDIDCPWRYYKTGDYPNVERYLIVFELVSALGLPRTASVLDAGCGGGLIARYLATRFDVVIASDMAVTPHMRAALECCHNIRFVTNILPDVPYGFGPFDLIVCSEVIEHLQTSDQSAALAGLGQALAPNGVLIVSTPNPRGLVVQMQRLVAILRGRKSRDIYGKQPCENWLTPGALSAIIPNCLIEQRRLGSYFVPPVEKRLTDAGAAFACLMSHRMRHIRALSKLGLYQYRVLRRPGDARAKAAPSAGRQEYDPS